MNSIFLRAKHWQLFIPLVAIPFVLFIALFITLIVATVNNPPKDPSEISWILIFFPIIGMLSGLVQFGWFWNVLTKISTLIPSGIVKLPMNRIKAFTIIPAIYMCVILPLFISMSFKNSINPNPGEVAGLVLFGIIVFFLHMFSMFCIMHTLFFVAKTIKIAEHQKNLPFWKFIGEFFLIWFFPVGVWFIQPRINKLIDSENNLQTIKHRDFVDDLA
ncbi:hypothetical protein [Fluviicola taffensis]|uniref:Uncharacterized protein n=1 Tax=Fluviicola taffensis (strain DSM 16823 / NCIMB 13979 / RW262) TaxID=755732 RepID=F2IDV2_FLUTR|nr:hypothetical protein [Fluviicola taffensis]AEA44494.1 hypothetical protein Fluta_2509 [Fluviicola taffensis DSM 16823]